MRTRPVTAARSAPAERGRARWVAAGRAGELDAVGAVAPPPQPDTGTAAASNGEQREALAA